MDAHGFGKDFGDSGAWMPGGLRRPVTEFCGIGRKAVALIYTMLTGEGWQAGCLDGWMAGWWLPGWLDGRHHLCNPTRSTPRRVGGLSWERELCAEKFWPPSRVKSTCGRPIGDPRPKVQKRVDPQPASHLLN